ncbi:MAG: chitosanase, partial [Acidobacteria bacterium]|nr:chitosanase [Acidobacteriota bacterium]MCA1608771.1 chitosanase [Acidobacteriota bacterium]
MFNATSISKAFSIVNIFETGRAIGNFAAVAVLDDGAGVSYGVGQFTHRSGSLAAVVEKSLASGLQVGRGIFEERIAILNRRDSKAIESLAADETFKKALAAAAATREMRQAQSSVTLEKYLEPAIAICERQGFKLPLSLAVVFDSTTHGSCQKIADRVRTRSGEKSWVTEYVILRHRWLSSIPRLKKTNYRTRFFLEQIAAGNWDLDLPIRVNGTQLTAESIEKLEQNIPDT